MIRNPLAMLLLAGFAGAAFASSCPILMKDIDAALKDPAIADRLSDEQLTAVRQLRKQGEEAHKDGDHSQSVEALNDARELLGILE